MDSLYTIHKRWIILITLSNYWHKHEWVGEDFYFIFWRDRIKVKSYMKCRSPCRRLIIAITPQRGGGQAMEPVDGGQKSIRAICCSFQPIRNQGTSAYRACRSGVGCNRKQFGQFDIAMVKLKMKFRPIRTKLWNVDRGCMGLRFLSSYDIIKGFKWRHPTMIH